MGQRPGTHKQQLAAVELHRITRGQLTAPTGFDGAIHAHITPLNAQLCLAAGAHQAFVLKKLVEFQGAA